MRRREFLKGAAAVGGCLLLPGCALRRLPRRESGAAEALDPRRRELAAIALEAARGAGASYADVRIAAYRRQDLHTREARLVSASDSEDRGCGVRVLAGGAWGFAASARLEPDELAEVARRAVALARTQAPLRAEPVALAPVEAWVDVWNTPIRRDPFEVPLEQKVETLLAINAAALAVPGVSFCSSWLACVREDKFFASSEGSEIQQTLHRCHPGFRATAIDRRGGDFQTRDAYQQPQGLGYEYVEDTPWAEEARRAGEDAVEKQRSPSVAPGARDLILHPSHLWLTIHESIGHSTELDRALGLEANYAGTSFLTPDRLGRFQLASPIVNFTAERTQPGALATCGYDDEGVKTGAWPLVREGIFVDYQTTREQARWIGQPRSHGCAHAQSWKDVAFQRMPNVNLEPAPGGPDLEALIAGSDDAILVLGDGSYSIDQQRYNFQFGGQTCYEVRGGRIRHMLKDVAYQSRTPDFWRACDAVGGAQAYALGGSFYDGKGEPPQVNAVSHGCPPARFRGIQVLNTARGL